MRYQNFDLWIEPSNGNGYVVRAFSEQFGVFRGFMQVAPEDPELQNGLLRLDQRNTNHQFLVQFGSRLYELLLTDKVEALFQQSYGAVMSREDWGLRIRLRIQSPEVAILPWELLYSPMAECFLGTMTRCPIMRYLDLHKPLRKLETPLPLRILVVIPGQIANYPDLQTNKEKEDLLSALDDVQDIVEVTFLEQNVSLTDISDTLLQQRYHCLHFIGHGIFQNDQGFLLLNTNGNNGQAEAVDEVRFAELFRNHETLKLVVLNSCKSASVSSTKPFVGMAPRLVQLGIPAVVAMQYAIYDDAAVAFARTFYRSLFKGWSKGNVEVAVSQARNQLASNYPDDRDMATPVLFLRAPEGVLFNPVTGRLFRDLPWAQYDLHTKKAVERTYKKTMQLLEEDKKKSFDLDTQQAITETMQELKSLQHRIRFRNSLLGMTLAVILCLFYLSWIKAFDFFTLDTRVETATIWLGDLFAAKHFSNDLHMIVIDDQSEDFLGKSFGPSWRKEHAQLIDLLSSAGAKTIAFGLTLTEASQHDDQLIQAVRRAEQRGTAVVMVMKHSEDDTDRPLDALRQTVRGYGPSCVGKKLGLARLAPLVVFKNDGSPLISFTLATIAAYQGSRLCDADREDKVIRLCGPDQQQLYRIPFSVLSRARQDFGGCNIRKGDEVADLLIDLSPLHEIRDPDRRTPYEHFFDLRDPSGLEKYTNKIVLVGKEGPGESTFSVVHGLNPGGEDRYGFELLADALNTVLQATVIQPLGQGGQLAIMVCLGLLGSCVRYWVPASPRYVRAGLLISLICIYLGSTIAVYTVFRVLLNTLYHIGALITAYWATGKAEKRWLG